MATILTAIALSVFGLMCLMSVFKPQWALVLILSFMGYEQLMNSFVPFLAQRSWVSNVVAAGFAGLALVSAMAYGRRPFRGLVNANTFLIISLYLLAYAGYTYSMAPEAAIYFIKTGIPYLVLMLGILPALVCTHDQIQRMSVPLLFVGCILIVLILISPRTEFYGTRLFIDLSYTGGKADRGNPLAIAEVGGLMVIVAALMNPRSSNLLISLLRLGAIILGLSIAFLVGSRGQLVSSAFIAILFYPLAHEIRNVKQFFLRAFSVGTFGFVMLFVSKVFLSASDATQRFSYDQLAQGISGRMYYITTMLQEYGARPGSYLQGLGTGSFNALVTTDSDGFLYPHNLVIEVLTHHGLIGFSILFGIFCVTGYHSWKLIRAGLQGAIDRSVVAIVLGLAGYVTLLSMKQGSFLVIPVPFYMYMVISKIYTRSVLDGEIGYQDNSDPGEAYSESYGDQDWDEGQD